MALLLCARDPRVPWLAKALAALAAGYALSPIDLIPDAIPVLGYLDDLILVPGLIALALRLVPPDVLAEKRAEAARRLERPRSGAGAVVVIGLWLAGAAALAAWLLPALT